MKSFLQFLEEVGKDSLFHFTSLSNFLRIISSDKIIANLRADDKLSGKSKEKSVSFTRDINRNFLPAATGKGIGLRFSRKKLNANNKIVPFSSTARLKSTQIQNGKELSQAKKQMDAKFESEERVWGDVKNVKKQLTGIVLPIGLIAKPTAFRLAFHLIFLTQNLFFRNNKDAFKIRQVLLDIATKFDIPFVLGRREFSSREIVGNFKRIFFMMKNDRDKFNSFLEKEQLNGSVLFKRIAAGKKKGDTPFTKGKFFPVTSKDIIDIADNILKGK